MMLNTNDDWRDDAACANECPELFFPVGRSRAAQMQIALAKRICADCPVKTECLRHAVEYDEQDGIWGGLDTHERRVLVASVNRQSAAQVHAF